MTARSIGLGDEFVALDGFDGLYSNPALVDINDRFFALEFNIAGEFWNNIFMNDIISESDKDKLLRIVDKNGMLVGANGNLGGKMAIGPIAVFADGGTDSLFQLSDDFAELLLKGNETEGRYDLDGTNGGSAFYASSGINYSFKVNDNFLEAFRSDSFKIENMYLGFTYRYLKGGFAKYQADGGFELSYDEDGVPVISGNDGKAVVSYTDIDDFSSMATGHAFDLGIYADYDDRFSWGLSILNIGASLETDSYREYEYGFEYKENEDENYEWDFIEPDDDGVLYYKTTEMKLPLVIKMGGKMIYTDTLDLLANYTITNYSDDIYIKKLTDHRFSAAVEYSRLKFLPLRLGVNYSTLESDFDIAAGLGLYLGPLRLDAGISDLSGLFYKSKGVAGGLNFTLVF